LENQVGTGLNALEEFSAWAPRDFEGTDCHVGTLEGVPHLADWREAVHFGRGFVLLRRVAIESLSEAEAIESFSQLAGQFGAPVEQAELIANAALASPLCSLPSDLSAFACLRAPEEGLAIDIASAVGLHNALLAQPDDTLAWLYQADGTRLPAFRRRGAKLSVRLDPAEADESARGRAVTRALDAAKVMALRIALEPGDLLIVNNHHTLVACAGRTGRMLRYALRAPLLSVPGFATSEPLAGGQRGEDAYRAA